MGRSFQKDRGEVELDWNQGANNSFRSKQTEASTCRDSLLELGKEGIGFLECAGLGGGCMKMVESGLGTRQREALKVRREQYGGIC